MRKYAFPSWLPMHLLGLAILALTVTTCQSTPAAEEATPAATVTEAPTATPLPASTETPEPVATNTEAPPEPTEAQPTVTSPVPSPTSPITPTPPVTPTPTSPPPPEPTFYTIEPGDSLVGVSEKFNLTAEALLYANGYLSPDELTLVVGNELQIPLCEAHQILPGNTLATIAQLCGLTLDELIIANIDTLAPLGTFDAVPVGFVLIIPQDTPTPEDLDCSPQPDREQIIEYTPQPGEGIFCLAQKFNLSTAAIIQGNTQRLTGNNVYGQVSLLIPPVNGAIYIVTADDVASGLTLEDLAEWYEVALDAITDWNGNPIVGPLSEGQQLFVVGASLAFGPFRLEVPEPEADGENEPAPTATTSG